MLSSGRKAEEAKAEVDAKNAQTAVALENPLRSPQLSSPGADSPPKTRAAELMELRKLTPQMKASFRHHFSIPVLPLSYLLVSLSARTQGGRSRGCGVSKEGTASGTECNS